MKWPKFSFLKIVFVFVLVFIFVYLVVNAPALFYKVRYWYISKFQNKPWPESYQVMPVNLQNNLGYILSPQKSPEEIQKLEKDRSDNNEIQLENNFLYIPKLGIKAPIIWEVEEANALSALENGVVHLAGTGLPGTDGNIFITGHSSYYWWSKGKYKTIFALLPNIDIKDQIYLTFQNRLYTYETTEKLVVWPKDTWVMDKLSYPALTLMTCVPVGTNLKRLIVRAKQISPSLEKEKPKPQPELRPTPDLLPPIF